MRVFVCGDNYAIDIDDEKKRIFEIPCFLAEQFKHVLHLKDRDVEFMKNMYLKQGYTVQ